MKKPGNAVATVLCFVLLASVAHAQLLLTEDFVYPAGDSLKLHDWVMTGSPSSYSYVNPLCVTVPGLDYPGYRGSGVGNATTLAPTGQDVCRSFAQPAKGGSVYVFFMVRVLSARTSGDYFFHLIGGAATSSVFAPKLSVKSSDSRLAFGISKRANANAAVYTPFEYGLDTTYLVVLKYKFKPDATTDDEVSLFVFGPSGFSVSEPAAPTVGPVIETSGTDVDSLCFCALRQGSSSSAPSAIVDGIRVTTSWEGALPIQISSFRGVVDKAGVITLTWTTQSEIDLYGFEVQRREGSSETFVTVSGLIPGHNTTTEPHTYTFADQALPPGRWLYRLKTISLDQSVSFSDVIEVSSTAGIVLEQMLPEQYGLEQNYPNPFNPTTRICYSVGRVVAPSGASSSGVEPFESPQGSTLSPPEGRVAWVEGPAANNVRLAVYDLLGREVVVLVNEQKAPGMYEVKFDGSRLASGLYICRMVAGPPPPVFQTESLDPTDRTGRAGSFTKSMKMLLVR